MKTDYPYVLSIAGFDPSAGAGILADIKTMEANGVYGLGVTTCITYQNDNSFLAVDWLNTTQILKQIEVLFERHPFKYVKIGLVKDFTSLNEILCYLKSLNHEIKIIWDPILKASAGFEFHRNVQGSILNEALNKIHLITPNILEINHLTNFESASTAGKELSKKVNVLLKGGHSETAFSNDILYLEGLERKVFKSERINYAKHGSGCVLSSAITSNLAKGFNMEESCLKAKEYTKQFLCSTTENLGFHFANIISHEQPC